MLTKWYSLELRTTHSRFSLLRNLVIFGAFIAAWFVYCLQKFKPTRLYSTIEKTGFFSEVSKRRNKFLSMYPLFIRNTFPIQLYQQKAPGVTATRKVLEPLSSHVPWRQMIQSQCAENTPWHSKNAHMTNIRHLWASEKSVLLTL